MTEQNFVALATTYLKEKRGFTDDMVKHTLENSDVAPTESALVVTMRDLDGNETGKLDRFYDLIVNEQGKTMKSKTHFDSEVGYFLPKQLNYEMPIAICEGEPDFWTLNYFYENTVGLQGIGKLHELIRGLQQRGAKWIFLFVDVDESTDKFITKIFGNKYISIETLYDSRHILVDQGVKDINDYYRKCGAIDVKEVMKNSKKLYEIRGMVDHSYRFMADIYPNVIKKNLSPCGVYSDAILRSELFNCSIFPVEKLVYYDKDGYTKKVEYTLLLIGKISKLRQVLKIDSSRFVVTKLIEMEMKKLNGVGFDDECLLSALKEEETDDEETDQDE